MSDEQFRDRIMDNIASVDALGIRCLFRLRCRWFREEYALIQVFEWPSLEAHIKQVAFEEQAEAPRLISQTHILGVKAP
jgi:hypothetical protein